MPHDDALMDRPGMASLHIVRAATLQKALLFALAIAALAAAIAFDAATWAEWFHHPGREPLPATTIEGAQWWRFMLVAAAVAIVIAPAALEKLSRPVPRAETLSAQPSGRPSWAVGMLLLLAFALRATRLNESLWYDEIAWYLSYGAGVDRPWPILGNYFDPVNHVLHTFLGWWSVKVFEPALGAELAFRAPALLFSLASVAVMHGFGRAVGGDRFGLFAGLVAAIAPVSVLEGAESRGYSMMICFAALMTWTLLEARRREGLVLWCFYAILCALGIWSHFVTAFVPVGHAVWIAWRAARFGERRLFFCGTIALGLGAVLTLTALSPLLPDFLHQRGVFFSTRGDEPTIFGAEGRHALMQLGGSWYWWAASPGLLLLALGVGSLWRNSASIEKEEQPRIGLRDAMSCSLIGLPIMALAVTLGGSWIYARFTFFALPGAMLLMAAGLERLWKWRPAAAISALVIVASGWAIDLAARPSKQPLREAADFVRTNRASNDQLIVIGLPHEVMRLYAADLNAVYCLQYGDDLARELPTVRPRWVVLLYPRTADSAQKQLLTESHYVPIGTFRGWADWDNGDVIIYRRD
jgi:hypothetical protein